MVPTGWRSSSGYESWVFDVDLFGGLSVPSTVRGGFDLRSPA